MSGCSKLKLIKFLDILKKDLPHQNNKIIIWKSQIYIKQVYFTFCTNDMVSRDKTTWKLLLHASVQIKSKLPNKKNNTTHPTGLMQTLCLEAKFFA